jgi:quinohemoprotein ethanol dehydrogenase
MDEHRRSWSSFVGTLAVVAVLLGAGFATVTGYLIGHFSDPKEKTVTVDAAGKVVHPTDPADEPAIAPAWTAAQLGFVGGKNWLTNGGGTSNARYSTLDEINDSNVADLKGEWMIHLGSGEANKYSQEGQPIAYHGVLYAPTGADDVTAVDVKTGFVKWRYKANLPDSLASTICCGWDNRGVALGDGKVYVAQLDATLVALDQRTGKVAWKAKVAKAADGFAITAAPLYADGIVYTSPAGADYGARGFLDAYDAKTGQRLWRHYMVPGPGEEGHDSWPSDNDFWKRGGANIWNTPSIDPKLGLLYVATANAGGDWDGSQRKGDNKWASSIVALDAKTGKFAWGYQQVHHDIWDYDSTSPTVLIDATINGQKRQGIAEPNKNGWVYFLDRKTGKPIFPIPEKPVAQSKIDATAATQPIPTMPAFSPQQVTPQMIKALDAAVAAQLPKGAKKPNIKPGHVYDLGVSRTNTVTAVAPSAAGGDNWPASSYNQDAQMYYVCSQDGAQAFLLNEGPQKFVKGQSFSGDARAAATTGFNNPGRVTAYDMTTGKIAWQVKYEDSCYSGTVTTKGNLVFVGRNGGQLEARNAKTGKLLWSWQTGAGANSTVTPFEHDGKEYIAFLAGGNALAGTPHGDNFWLFSLDGTLGPAKAPAEAGTAIQHAGEAAETEDGGEGTAQDVAPDSGDATAGKQIFADNCGTCHGLSGHGGNGGPDLSAIPDAKEAEAVVKQVTNGGGGMPAFGGQLSDKDIANVAAYVSKTIAGGG